MVLGSRHFQGLVLVLPWQVWVLFHHSPLLCCSHSGTPVPPFPPMSTLGTAACLCPTLFFIRSWLRADCFWAFLDLTLPGTCTLVSESPTLEWMRAEPFYLLGYLFLFGFELKLYQLCFFQNVKSILWRSSTSPSVFFILHCPLFLPLVSVTGITSPVPGRGPIIVLKCNLCNKVLRGGAQENEVQSQDDK